MKTRSGPMDEEVLEETSAANNINVDVTNTDTMLGVGDVNLVSICLVLHELPELISKQIFQEIYNILPSGGVISIMDMNPDSKYFRKFAANPFAFAAFKSTEPWIQEYVTMDLYKELNNVGFHHIEILENSPRHRTVVAFK